MNYKGFYHTFLLAAFQTCDWRSHKVKELQLVHIGDQWRGMT